MPKKLALLLMWTLLLPCMAGEEATKKPWSDELETALVYTGGNTEASTFSLQNKFNFQWTKTEFWWKVSALSAETTTVTRIAYDNGNGPVVEETKDTEKTVENYKSGLGIKQVISGNVKWFTEAHWERDRFKGLDMHSVLAAGLNHTWSKEETWKFELSYGISYAKEEQSQTIVPVDESYLGYGAAIDWFYRISPTTKFMQEWYFSGNADESSDFKGRMVHGLEVHILQNLALKLVYEADYDHEPAWTAIELIDNQGASVGLIPFQLDELDTKFRATVVMRF